MAIHRNIALANPARGDRAGERDGEGKRQDRSRTNPQGTHAGAFQGCQTRHPTAAGTRWGVPRRRGMAATSGARRRGGAGFAVLATASGMGMILGYSLGVGGRLDSVGPCPRPALFHAHAATAPPAFLGALATAHVVFARKTLASILGHGNRQWNAEGGRHIGEQDKAGQQPARLSPNHPPGQTHEKTIPRWRGRFGNFTELSIRTIPLQEEAPRPKSRPDKLLQVAFALPQGALAIGKRTFVGAVLDLDADRAAIAGVGQGGEESRPIHLAQAR